MQKIVIIDYGSGNIHSVENAFVKVISDHDLPFEVLISSKPEDVLSANRIILPGQGAFGDCIHNLKSVPGMIEALEQAVLKDNIPFLGICVGMQLLMTKGYEHGEYDGLGWIDGSVIAIEPEDKNLKIPHMGWNTLKFLQLNHPVIKNQSKNDAHFYFVHSFMVESKEKDVVVASTYYGVEIPAIISKDNIIGIQCHPEKSQTEGLAFLYDFLLWKPV